MPTGPGKYGARAATLLEEVDADAVVVITIGGRDGEAFDVACVPPGDALLRLPSILRAVAAAIERDLGSAVAALHGETKRES